MIRAKENKHYILAFTIGFLGPKIFKLLRWFISKKIQEEKKKKIFNVGISIHEQQYQVIIGQPKFNPKLSLNIKNQLKGSVTQSYENTLKQIVTRINHFLKNDESYEGVGISSFGSLELDKNHLRYGFIVSAERQSWIDIPLLFYLSNNLKPKQIGIETNANSAALAQFLLGNHKAKESLVYVRVSNHVQVGVIHHKKPVHGLTHPKSGHILLDRHLGQRIGFNGECHYHKNCLEGLISIKGIKEKYKLNSVSEIPVNHEVWDVIGFYLAQLCFNMSQLFSPEVFVFDGQLINNRVITSIQSHFIKYIQNCVHHSLYQSPRIHELIKKAQLGEEATLLGTLLIKNM